ncbi:S1-like domain-containing RNA-binding protein [Lentibacillus jeotgali]|uniref:S1-like domain-containing RNA-binding protein n=1 Tax=Lentibacillus jeotgali TaxID=558169 RepID=UPI0002625CE3
MKIGTTQTMKVMRQTEAGYILQNDVFLPAQTIEADLETGQKVDVFLYHDQKGSIFATGNHPSVQVNEYDWVEVIEVIPELGAFVDIGIEKDILVSSDDLPRFESVWPAKGDMLFVTLTTDKKGRLLAEPASEKFFAEHWELAPEELINKPISGRVYNANKEGSAIISEHGYRGFIHHTERKQEPRLGEWVEGRVIQVKADGTLNVSLRLLKQQSMQEDADDILKQLEQNSGVIHFSDKSDSEDIRGTFGISKAAFKRALGKLMKEGKIEQRNGKTYLIQP